MSVSCPDDRRRADIYLFDRLVGHIEEREPRSCRFREHSDEWHLSKAYDLVPVETVMPADDDDLALTNGRNRKLKLDDFRKATDSMRFTPVQFARSIRHVTSGVRRHLDEALAHSFLSDDFKSRFTQLVSEHLKKLEQ